MSLFAKRDRWVAVIYGAALWRVLIQRMGLRVHLTELGDRDVGVDLGRRDVRVSELLLDMADVGAVGLRRTDHGYQIVEDESGGYHTVESPAPGFKARRMSFKVLP